MCVNANLLTFSPKLAFKALLTVCTALTYIYFFALCPDGTITDVGLFSDVTYFSLDNGS